MKYASIFDILTKNRCRDFVNSIWKKIHLASCPDKRKLLCFDYFYATFQNMYNY